MVTDTASQRQPLYLFADSQLLFWKRRGRLLLEAAVAQLPPGPQVAAAYIGASNQDRPEFYDLCKSALDAAGIADHRMIQASLTPDDREFLDRARLIVLAGGDVRVGWETFTATGMDHLILKRYAEGAILVGVSAGAVQLGTCALVEAAGGASEMVEMFALSSMVIDVHDEAAGWMRLSRTIRALGGTTAGLAIPSGGGVIVHTDGYLEALRRPAHLYRFDGTRLTHTPLTPAERD